MPLDLMLDIETIGARPDAAVLSIGAVVFDRAKQYTHDDPLPFYHVILDLEEQSRYRSFDGGAVRFWLEQSDEARKVQLGSTVPVKEALKLYIDFVYKNMPSRPRLGWANGATFDHVIVESLFAHHRLRNPIHFKNQVCMRTLRRLFDGLLPDHYENRPTDSIAHSALDDCKSQVVWLTKALSHLYLINQNPTFTPNAQETHS
jgi:hypothetical protein